MKRLIISLLVSFLLLSTSILGASLTIKVINQNQNENYNVYSRLKNDFQETLGEPISLTQKVNNSIWKISNEDSKMEVRNGPMNSSWPMYCHDTHHTGRSPYSTINDTPGYERWCFKAGTCDYLYGSPVIGNGTIYFGGFDFFALSQNGSMKWKYDNHGHFESAPAIDENGIIYIGTISEHPSHLYAFYPDGTVKWAYQSGENIFSSPVIGSDGTIYYGGESHSINALWPNGTLRWRYQTDFIVYSSPAIGDDGTVYCGCHDGYLYALYPNNGTLKWRFPTGDWIRTSPCIGDDGTIYCVSLDGYLYALYPNGSMKWRTNVGAGTSPTIGTDGTIYAGWDTLYAINPDGSVKWAVDAHGDIEGGIPCTSKDGIIYYGTSNGYIVAVNPNGTKRWMKYIGECQMAPAIDDSGTVYIGDGYGYLHAFGGSGEPKTIEVLSPEPGRLYVFGLNVGYLPWNNSVIIGSVIVKVKVYSENEIDSVHFSGGGLEYIESTPPFEWNLNRRSGNLLPLKQTIIVTAYYRGGCSWTDSITVWYFHLLKI
jgi:outer membrane protein assembly factor BamB